MIKKYKDHRRSLTNSSDAKPLKLPFLNRKLNISPLSPRENPEKPSPQYTTPKSQLSKFAENISSTILSMEIPQLRYSSFRNHPETLKKSRRKSEFSVPYTELLMGKYNIPVPEPKSLNFQQVIKESIVNKKPFKRIEPCQIESPSRNLGQKLIRVQELVIDPLMVEGDFN
jgi:hypothetical protein